MAIPPRGQVLVIGAFNVGAGVTMTDLAFDSAGILYGVGSFGGAHLYTINTSTGPPKNVTRAIVLLRGRNICGMVIHDPWPNVRTNPA